jgi:hypothetical protein
MRKARLEPEGVREFVAARGGSLSVSTQIRMVG